MSQGNSAGFVRVMRSHDYNQFEVCLPLGELDQKLGRFALQYVDEVRKEAARLVDKAVHQFEQRKRAMLLACRLSADEGLQLDQDYAAVMQKPRLTWTPGDKATVALMRQKEWLKDHQWEYDYEDEAPEFDDTDAAF